jgi:hypothetical protein
MAKGEYQAASGFTELAIALSPMTWTSTTTAKSTRPTIWIVRSTYCACAEISIPR